MSQTADSNPPAPAASAAGADEPMDSTLELLYSAIDKKEPAAATPQTPDPTEPENQQTTPPAEPAKPTPPAEPAPIAVRKRKKATPEPVAPAAPVTPPATPTPPPAATPNPDEEFEAGLLDEEREQLEYAREAERLQPEKYKGQAAKVKKFLKEHQDYLEKAKKDDADFDASSDPTYKDWLAKNNPVLSNRQIREIERLRAVEDAKKDTDAKINELREDMHRRAEEPIVKAETDKFFAELADEGLPAEVKAVLKEKGAEEAQKLFPVEFREANAVMSEAAKSIEEFIAITRRVKPFDKTNVRHTKLLDFIGFQCDSFKKTGGELLVRDGKQFLTRDEYFARKPEERANHWTFSNKDIIAMAKMTAAATIKQRVAQVYKEREGEGWVRPKPPAAPTAPATPPPAGAPPAPRGAQIPAPSTPADDKGGIETDLLFGKSIG